MSSFLDSTGLSELANKLKSYFCKQDGSYTSLNSGGLLVTEIGTTNTDLDDYYGGTASSCYFWSYSNVSRVAHAPFNDATWMMVYPQNGTRYARQVAYRRGTNSIATRYWTGSAWTSWKTIPEIDGTYTGMTVGTARDYDTTTGTIQAAFNGKATKFTLPDSGNASRYAKLGTIAADTSGSGRILTFICSCADGIGGNIADTYLVEYNNRWNAKSVVQTLLSPKANASSRWCKFGYIPNNDESIDVVVYLPAYSPGGEIVFLKRHQSFTWSYTGQVDGTNFVQGTRYAVAVNQVQ